MDRFSVIADMLVDFENALGKPDSATFPMLARCGIEETIIVGKGYISKKFKKLITAKNQIRTLPDFDVS